MKNSLLVVALVLVALIEIALVHAARGQQIPPIETQFFNSKSYAAKTCIRNGQVLTFDRVTKLFSCGTGGAGVPFEVTLSNGVQTTWSLPELSAAARVSCGCGSTGATNEPACRLDGEWVSRPRVQSVAQGSVVLRHGYSLGGERLRCAYFQ